MTQPNTPKPELEEDVSIIKPAVEPVGRAGSIICDDVPPVERTLKNLMRHQRRIG